MWRKYWRTWWVALSTLTAVALKGSKASPSTNSTGYFFIDKTPGSECVSNCKSNKTQAKINEHVQRFRRNNPRNVHRNGDDSIIPTIEAGPLYRPSRRRDAGALAVDGDAGAKKTESRDILPQRTDHYSERLNSVAVLHWNNFVLRVVVLPKADKRPAAPL